MASPPLHSGIRDPKPLFSVHQQFLQILGALTIVAFHVGFPFADFGWAAVEIFFVMAGINMSGALHREEPLTKYFLSRYRRLVPELSVVWLLSLVLLAAGLGTTGMEWFVISSPFFVHNLTVFFFKFDLPTDAVFGPLWFLGALIQLQVTAFACRRFLINTSSSVVLTGAVILGVLSRMAFGCLFGQPVHLNSEHGLMLYCMPYCHLESIIIGILIGQGKLRNLGRLLPLFIALLLIGGAAVIAGREDGGTIANLGYLFPLHEKASQLWGYPLLAFAAASLCAPEGPVAKRINGIRFSPRFSLAVSSFAASTYGIYCFHGLVISSGINERIVHGHSSLEKTLLFSLILIQAWLISIGVRWLFRQTFFHRLQETRWKTL
jgi:hypothetical protein